MLRSVVQWNGDEPTGYLGLGWTLETPRIVVDTKNSGRTQDDIYYLQLGGNKQRLMLDPGQAQSDTLLNFRTQQWSAWKIQFSPVSNGADGKWMLTDENGLIYRFDGASVSGGVQIYPWQVADRTEVAEELAAARPAATTDTAAWYW